MVYGYSSPTVCSITGVPPSTLNYWVATGVVSPSLRGRAGRRATHWWTLRDLIAVRTVKALRDAGCPLQTLRRAQAVIEEAGLEGLGDAVLHWDGLDLLRIGEFGDVESVIEHPGQGVLHLVAIPIGRWEAELADLAVEVDAARLRSRDEARSKRTPTPWRSATG